MSWLTSVIEPSTIAISFIYDNCRNRTVVSWYLILTLEYNFNLQVAELRTKVVVDET